MAYNVRVYAMWRNDTIFPIIALYDRGLSRAAYTLLYASERSERVLAVR